MHLFIYLFAFLENTCFVCNSMGNWPVGGYSLYFDALKGLLLKNVPDFFLIFAENDTLP